VAAPKGNAPRSTTVASVVGGPLIPCSHCGDVLLGPLEAHELECIATETDHLCGACHGAVIEYADRVRAAAGNEPEIA
jgi:hypothetical protein